MKTEKELFDALRYNAAAYRHLNPFATAKQLQKFLREQAFPDLSADLEIASFKINVDDEMQISLAVSCRQYCWICLAQFTGGLSKDNCQLCGEELYLRPMDSIEEMEKSMKEES